MVCATHPEFVVKISSSVRFDVVPSVVTVVCSAGCTPLQGALGVEPRLEYASFMSFGFFLVVAVSYLLCSL